MNYQNLFNRDFYPTPKSVIDLMMQGEDVTDRIILEPSAGSGNIVQWLVGHGAGCVMACEINDTLRRSLRDCDIIGTDFLDVTKCSSTSATTRSRAMFAGHLNALITA